MASKDKVQEKKRQARRRSRKRKRRQERRQKRQQWTTAQVVCAKEKPKPEPRAAGHLMARFWQHFKFDKVLEGLGQIKCKGLSLATLCLVLMLFGMMNAQSDSDLCEKVRADPLLSSCWAGSNCTGCANGLVRPSTTNGKRICCRRCRKTPGRPVGAMG